MPRTDYVLRRDYANGVDTLDLITFTRAELETMLFGLNRAYDFYASLPRTNETQRAMTRVNNLRMKFEDAIIGETE